jgi:large subunit ribosomal protein L35Ae
MHFFFIFQVIKMKATIVQFRRGRKTYHPRHFLLNVDAKNRAEAEKFVGKEVVWTSQGKDKKQIKGHIASAHGNNGLVRAIFEKGLPGQAVTTEVDLKNSEKKSDKSQTKIEAK